MQEEPLISESKRSLIKGIIKKLIKKIEEKKEQ